MQVICLKKTLQLYLKKLRKDELLKTVLSLIINFCNYPKFYYNPLDANNDYKYTLKDSREGSTFTLTEFNQIDEIISNGLKKRSKR